MTHDGQSIVKLHKRITVKKDNRLVCAVVDKDARWAVCIDGVPMATGLTKSEVQRYKKQALEYMLKN